jgi:hypothetical protein
MSVSFLVYKTEKECPRRKGIPFITSAGVPALRFDTFVYIKVRKLLRCHFYFFIRRCPFTTTWANYQVVEG